MKLKEICVLAIGGYMLLAAKCGGGINDPITVTLPSPLDVAETVGTAAVQTVDVIREASEHIQENRTAPDIAASVYTSGSDNGAESRIYRIRRAWNEPATQLGAYFSLEIARQNCPTGYTIFDENGSAVN